MPRTMPELLADIKAKIKRELSVENMNRFEPVNRNPRHPAGGQNRDSDTWETDFFTHKDDSNLGIILQYNKSGRIGGHHKVDGAQGITIKGYQFNAINLFIYDKKGLPTMNHIGRQEVRNKLNERLPEQHEAYYIKDGDEDIGTAIGHVCDLYIRDTGTEWNVSSEGVMTPANFVEKISATLADLLKVFEEYARNRDAIWERQN